MANYPAQIEFLQKVKSLIPAHQSIADALSDLLEISNDSVYRRIRGESALSLDETIKICQAFNIGLDSVLPVSNSSNTSFNYDSIRFDQQQLHSYLQSILKDLEGISKIQGARILYGAEDLPLFHDFYFKEHFGFKMFYWMKSVLNVPEFQQAKYSPDIIPAELFETAQRIVSHYDKIASDEIWTDGVLDSTLKQIRYYWESGFFQTKEIALTVCDQFAATLEKARGTAETGLKKSGASFSLYLSDIKIGNNCILVEVAGKKKVYVRHQTFNFISTSHDVFCQDTENWLKNYISKSTPVSAVSEKERNRFFNRKMEEIKAVREFVNKF